MIDVLHTILANAQETLSHFHTGIGSASCSVDTKRLETTAGK